MSSKTTEELLAILEASKDEVEKNPTDIELFIRDHEIVPSDNKVRSSYIYWAYMNWKEQGNGFEAPLARLPFFRRFSKYFKSGRMGHFRYYKINGEKLRISRCEHDALVEDLKQERQHRQWLKNREKKGT